jgi:hypothetical protein
VHTCRCAGANNSEKKSEDVLLMWSGCGLQCQVSVCHRLLIAGAEVHVIQLNTCRCKAVRVRRYNSCA